MKELIKKINQLNIKEPIAIIGSGATGRSFFDLLQVADIKATLLDENPKKDAPSTYDKYTHYACSFHQETFNDYATILISPGIDHRRECFETHQNKLLTDIELFAQITDTPIIGITGSNGKSTVTTLIHKILIHSGKKAALCGNIGTPVLKALLDTNNQLDYYIVELSSYHLEKSPSLKLAIGLLLNISADHLDRYRNFDDYAQTKGLILDRSQQVVINFDDATVKKLCQEKKLTSFIGFSHKKQSAPHLFLDHDTIYCGEKPIFKVTDSPLMGKHNYENIMAAICTAELLGIQAPTFLDVLQTFSGLLHRSEWVTEKNGVTFINDSKGTNVGATVATILGLERPILLLAGGDAKQQDFSPFVSTLKNQIKKVFLFGRDKELIKTAIDQQIDWEYTTSLEDAVKKASAVAESGDVVLLSPACASFDQFKNYQQRGDLFKKTVLEGGLQ